MKQPAQHERMHPMWPNRWDPYERRDYVVHLLDRTSVDALWRDNQSAELFSTGCLDAPDDIPLGATACVRTVGGYAREEYRTLGREWESWSAYMRASNATAEMLKQILKEVDA